MTQPLANLFARTTALSGKGKPYAASLLLCVWPCVAAAQEHPPEHTRAELRAQVAGLEGLVRACAAAQDACDVRAVPLNETIAAEGAEPQFTLRWDWLAQALDTAKTARPEKDNDQVKLDGARQDAMRASLGHLEEIAQQAGAVPPEAEQASFATARRTANEVLSRVEFDKVAPASWWDRMVAKFWAWVERLFDSVGQLGAHRPWVGKLLEILFFVTAAAGLLVFLRRNFQRQRLAASLRVDQAARSAWDRDATDWAALADSAAANGEWRDAVHCLYWASIVRLESRRAWRHNPARTPREYVRLLKPGSVQRESLGGLTGLLERVWYGLRPAGAEEYSRARAWFERLSESRTAGTESAAGSAVGSQTA